MDSGNSTIKANGVLKKKKKTVKFDEWNDKSEYRHRFSRKYPATLRGFPDAPERSLGCSIASRGRNCNQPTTTPMESAKLQAV